MTHLTKQRFFASTALTCLVMLASPAFAKSDAAADAQDASTAPVAPAAPAADAKDSNAVDIIVTAQRFIDLNTTGATKLPMAIDKIPQSVSLISRNLLDGLNIKTAGQLAAYVPGLQSQGAYYGFRSEVKSRGFALDNNYGYKIDGFQYARFFEFDDAMLDRVEVVRGPSSATYGIAAPGGLINYVLKDAPSQAQGSVSLSYGSFNDIRGRASAGGPLNASGSLRGLMVVNAESSDSFVDYVHSKNISLGAIVDWDVTDRLSLKGTAYLTRTEGVPNDGVPIYADGTLSNTSRSLFLGSVDRNRMNFKGDLLFGEAKYKVTDNIELGGSFSYQKTYLNYVAFYPLTLSTANVTSIRASKQVFPQHQTSGEIYAMAKFSLFGVEGSSFRVSGSFYNSIYEQQIYSGSRNPIPGGPLNVPVNIFSGSDSIQSQIAALTYGFLFTTPYQNKAKIVSAQTVLKPLEHLSIIGGITLNDPTVTSGTSTFKYGSKMSYRAGLLYEVIHNLNLYGSYSTSFFPQQNFDVNRNPLAPLKGQQWEVGAKAKFFNGGLLATLAAFDIKQSNAAVLIPGSVPQAYRPYGQVRHKGIEAEVVGNISRNVNVYGGLTYLDARISQSTVPGEQGSQRPFVPTWTSSLFTTYTFTDGALSGFRLGLGGHSVGSMPTSSTGTTKRLPGYAVFDGLASYTTGPWEVRVNFNNILDKNYRISTYDDLTLGFQYGMPRNAQVTVSRKF